MVDPIEGAGQLLAPRPRRAADRAGDLAPPGAFGAEVGELPFLVAEPPGRVKRGTSWVEEATPQRRGEWVGVGWPSAGTSDPYQRSWRVENRSADLLRKDTAFSHSKHIIRRLSRTEPVSPSGERTVTRNIGSLLRSRVMTAGLLFVSLLAQPANEARAGGFVTTTFATSTANYNSPDSIAVGGGFVYVGFNNNGVGGTSTIVQYTMGGAVVKTLNVSGFNDGLSINPANGQIWALQNQDGPNPNLAVINPTNLTATTYSLTSVNGGGGFDDVTFVNGQAYLSASNPQKNPNTDPAIVSAAIVGNSVNLTSVLMGTATATNTATGATTNLDLIDPDAMTHDRNGNLVLTDETQNQLIFVHHPGTTSQSQSFLNITTAGLGSINLDETNFPNGPGFMLATDQTTGVIYKVQGSFTAAAYAASPDNGLWGTLDLGTGQLTPINIGIGNVHGMAFVSVPEPTSIVPAALGCLAVIGWCRSRRRECAAG
jgi:hypothetical protein